MKKFGLIGAGGYIAPSHMQAVQDSGHKVVAVLDPNDSVGILDRFFPQADFFVEFERFDRHVDKLKRAGEPIDYISICSPNYLHDAHVRFALKNGADAICESPLVLNPWNVESLEELEGDTGKRIFSILPLRLSPSFVDLKERVDQHKDRIHDVDLTCIHAFGQWYFVSWRGQPEKSGGLVTDMGLPYFDLLIWIFGKIKRNVVHVMGSRCASGYLELEKARVRWFLSANIEDLPDPLRFHDRRLSYSLVVDGQEMNSLQYPAGLHTKSYWEILNGQGFGLEDARLGIEAAYEMRQSEPIGVKGDFHPLVHPYKRDGRLNDLIRRRSYRPSGVSGIAFDQDIANP